MTIKIYTKVGDKGLTKQVTGKIVPKYDLQIEALGNVDELQSYLGVVIANLSKNCRELRKELETFSVIYTNCKPILSLSTIMKLVRKCHTVRRPH